MTVLPPFHACTGGGKGDVTLTCKYDDFKAGAKTEIVIITAARVPAKFPATGVTFLLLRWTISPDGGTDRNFGDNTYVHKFWICGSAAKDPVCNGAK